MDAIKSPEVMGDTEGDMDGGDGLDDCGDDVIHKSLERLFFGTSFFVSFGIVIDVAGLELVLRCNFAGFLPYCVRVQNKKVRYHLSPMETT
jgi:hypothetical protein